jgi:hypothetical protein
MIRTIVVVLLACSILVGACHRHARTHDPSTTDYRMAPTDTESAGAAEPSGCERGCAHYLQCRGVTDERTFGACVQQCTRMRYSEADLASFERTDCAAAIAIVEGKQQAPAQQQQQQQKSSECNGCVWDGSSCMWVSQSNWGTGPNSPYSGAVSSCNAYCCGH